MDKEIILRAVSANGLNLQYVPKEFKDDFRTVLTIAKRYSMRGYVLSFLYERLKNDEDAILKLSRQI